MKVVVESNNQNVLVQSVEQDPKRETLYIFLANRPLVVGSQYRISMRFTAYLNDELRGFYRSSYIENGVTK